MLEIRKTDVFAKWLDGLRDVHARARILLRVERLAAGNRGNVKPVGEGVSELRIDYGPGYRVYYKQQRQEVVVLLWLAATNVRSPATSRQHCALLGTCRIAP
jgi:putative addiction module killer protein